MSDVNEWMTELYSIIYLYISNNNNNKSLYYIYYNLAGIILQ